MTLNRSIALTNVYFIVVFLFVLLALIPKSLQLPKRQKRQITFPSDNSNSGPACLTPDNRRGICVPLESCSIFSQINSVSRLRQFLCGYLNDEPQVCCPPLTRAAVSEATTAAAPSTLSAREPPRRPITSTARSITTTRRLIASTTRRPLTSANITSTTSRSITVRPAELPVGLPAFLPQDCGHSPFAKTRIIGGKEAEKGSWPWMVVVYHSRGGAKSFECGGTLVTNQHVVTAAHCVVIKYTTTPLKARQINVRLGEHDLKSSDDGMNPIDVSVMSFLRHENYNPLTYENDIAILKLVEPIQFTNHIQPICMPYNSMKDEDYTGRKAFIAGWGSTKFNGPTSSVLMEASFVFQDQELCREVFKEELPITRAYICAGKLDGSKDSCQGDSGGPLMGVGPEKRYYLVGIVSFGKYCATPRYPGVYTRVTEFLNWMQPLLTR